MLQGTYLNRRGARLGPSLASFLITFLMFGTVSGQVVAEWIASYEQSGTAALVLDPDGNVFVTGSRRTPQGPSMIQFLTIKYDPSGRVEWVATHDPRPGYNEGAHLITRDSQGDLYVAGTSCRSNACDYKMLKYDKQGKLQWSAIYDGPARGYDVVKALALDPDGNPCLAGASEGIGTGLDYATIKYDKQDGSELWVARFHGRIDGDGATALAVDSTGNIYVTGHGDQLCNPRCADGNYVTVKYDPYGNEQWVARYGPRSGAHIPRAIVVDPEGNVYITGTSEGFTTLSDYATVKYDANGREVWATRYSGWTRGINSATALALDPDGNVCVTGWSLRRELTYDFDYVTLQYDQAGNELWMARYDGSGNGWDEPGSIVVDADRNVYVAGYSEGAGTRYDFATVKYDRYGQEQWVARYDGPSSGHDSAKAIAVDPQKNVYVTGASTGKAFSESITLKYRQK